LLYYGTVVAANAITVHVPGATGSGDFFSGNR